MRIFLTIVACLFILAGAACAAPAVVTYRAIDSDGFISGSGRMTTATSALVTNTAQFKEITEKEVEEGRTGGDVVLRFEAERTDGGPVLVAVGSADSIDALVLRGSHEVINDIAFSPFEYQSVVIGGARPIGPSETGLFDVVASGEGRQQVSWKIQPGAWRAVIMNADGSPGVDVDVRFGARFPYLKGFAIAAMVIGGTVIVLGILWLAFLYRPGRNRRPPEATPAGAG